MIGNDIVDLQLAKQSSRWNSKRFVEKLFSTEEQRLIQNSGSNQFELIWLLWSMKESAYKVHVQRGYTPSFAPFKLHCQLEDQLAGTVTIDKQVYETASKVSSNCIYTFSILSNKNSLLSYFDQLQAKSTMSVSEICYKAILLEYCNFSNSNYDEVRIKKDRHNVPQIYRDQLPLDVELSITHHGQFYGYAMMI